MRDEIIERFSKVNLNSYSRKLNLDPYSHFWLALSTGSMKKSFICQHAFRNSSNMLGQVQKLLLFKVVPGLLDTGIPIRGIDIQVLLL